MAYLLAAKVLPMNCRICRNSEDHRLAWGCKKATIDPQFETRCPECEGGRIKTHERTRGGKCFTCKGAGTYAVHRCPQHVLGQSNAGETRALNFFSVSFHPHGLLPRAGGFWEMPATFCQAMEYLTALHSNQQEESAKKLAERAGKRQRGKR